MYEYARRPEVCAYLLWSPHPDLSYTKRYIARLIDVYKKGQCYDWAAIEKEDGKMIGTAGYASFDVKNRTAEIGYVLSSDYWHRGYGTEIARELIDFAFSALGANRVQARYMTDNVYSRAVMEKCGMIYEGTARSLLFVKDWYRDIGTCAILREEYLSRRPLKIYPQKKRCPFF